MLMDTVIPRIHVLDQTLANQIAAGEVVERPASVVKELLENALDANPSRITIALERGGNTLIRINDNGVGIHPDDLPLVLQRHSTSKIKQFSDLETLQTLGFRGEALASISSVSEFSIVTAVQGETAQKLIRDSTGALQISPAAMSRGTTIEVRNLFFNTPARRKFLRSEQTEYLHCNNMVKRQVLGRFDVSFQLLHNDRRTLNLSSCSHDYTHRIAQVCGQRFLKESIPIEFEHGGMRLWGWLGKPCFSRNQTDLQYFYLNGRYLRDKQINHAVRLAYSEQIPTGRYPCYVLFFEIDFREVDINVHPSKQEVRFAKIRHVHDFIFGCISRAFDDKPYPIARENQADYALKDTRKSDRKMNMAEAIEYYPEQEKQKCLKLAIVADRFLIFILNEKLGLFDSYAARIEKAKKMIQSEHEVTAMPLLRPRTIIGSEQYVEAVMKYRVQLKAWGIIFLRVAPKRIHISHLPQGFECTDFQTFFNEVNTKTNIINPEEMLTILIKHINSGSEIEQVEKAIHRLFDEVQNMNSMTCQQNFTDQTAVIRLLSTENLQHLLNNKI